MPPLTKGDGTYAASPTDKLDALLPYLQPNPNAAHDAAIGGGGGDREGEADGDEGEADGAEGEEGPDDGEGEEEENMPWPDLTEQDVSAALYNTRPFAAPGPDTLPNFFLQTLWPVLRLRILPLYSAILRLGHLPASWRDASGMILRKPKKDDYTHPKSYRLISFERTMAKLLEKVVARRLAFLSEKHGLMPPSHFGGRRGRAAEEAVATAVDVIHRQWRNGQAVVGLALDVAMAFPSVDADRLEQDLKEKGAPRPARLFLRSWMSNRTVTIHLDGVSRTVSATGLPQGSALSPIVYCLYNSSALESAESEKTCGFGWIDDLNLFAWGKTVSDAVANLRSRIPQLEAWSTSHKSRFEPTKSDLVIFLPPSKSIPPNPPPLHLNGTAVLYSPSLTMLGAVLDSRLTFDAHVARCAAKSSTALTGVKALMGARNGVTMRLGKQLVEAVVEPRRNWMAGVWWKRGESEKRVKVLRAVQRESARLVSGCYRTAALDAMEVESGLTPLEVSLETAAARLALRLLTAHPSHPTYRSTRLALATPAPRSHPSPIHRALSSPFLPPLPRPLEQLDPDPIAPWTPIPAVTVEPVVAPEEAIQRHHELVASLGEDDGVAYSDGSEKEGSWTGAGVAVRVRGGGEGGETLWAKTAVSMGQAQGVYAGELLGIQAALELLPALFPPSPIPQTLAICADNSSAITAPFDPHPSSGQHIRLRSLALLQQLQRTHPLASLQLVWVPGHAEVGGNEEADKLAKTGAEWGREEDEAAKARELLARRAQGRVAMPMEYMDMSWDALDESSECKSTPANQTAQQASQADVGGTEARGSGWTEDEMAAWPGEGEGEERPQWTGWVLDDERRYPPVARARFAGASNAYDAVRTQVDLVTSATEHARLDVARERRLQDARYVADGGDPATQPAAFRE
ncbi:hypothetical protein JCM8097_003271 [Rhodosporidiobolus ruineniae]